MLTKPDTSSKDCSCKTEELFLSEAEKVGGETCFQPSAVADDIPQLDSFQRVLALFLGRSLTRIKI